MKANLEIRHCRALIAVADEGGIARAAESLGIAQSTLSETLISLERAVGTRMVLRQRGVEARLTSAADILLPHARRIAAAADAATAMVAAEANILRVGAVESISSYLLPSAIRAVRSSHPEARLQVTVGLCADLQSQVTTGRLDVAMLLRGAQSPSRGDLVIHRLGTSQLRLIVKSDGPLAGRRLDPAELARIGVVVPDPHGPLNDLLEGWLEAQGAKGCLSPRVVLTRSSGPFCWTGRSPSSRLTWPIARSPPGTSPRSAFGWVFLGSSWMPLRPRPRRASRPLRD